MNKRRPRTKLPTQSPTLEAAAVTAPQDHGKPAKRHVRASLYLPLAVHEVIRSMAFEQRRSQHDLLREAVYEWVERKTGKAVRNLLAAVTGAR